MSLVVFRRPRSPPARSSWPENGPLYGQPAQCGATGTIRGNRHYTGQPALYGQPAQRGTTGTIPGTEQPALYGQPAQCGATGTMRDNRHYTGKPALNGVTGTIRGARVEFAQGAVVFQRSHVFIFFLLRTWRKCPNNPNELVFGKTIHEQG